MKKIFLFFASYILLSCSQVYYSGTSKNNIRKDSLIITEMENDTCCMNRLILSHNGHSDILFKIHCEDGSSIDFVKNIKGKKCKEKIGVYAIYNAAADGNSFLFFDYLTRRAYITPACFSDCLPEYTSLDFKKRSLILRNTNSFIGSLNDTLNIGDRPEYVVCGKRFHFVKAILNVIN
ncbi:MAG: hypothetical protein ACFNVZ_09330 [Prevotella melaninogenica]